MRVVKDINSRVTTEEQRRAYDTFIRPTVDDTDSKRLYQLSETLNRISPVIRNYKEEAEQAFYNAEVARGYAASANFKPDEVPADKFYRYSSVNANEYAKRSRAFQHGVNIHEAEALANTLPTAADEWFRTQKYNGRRIYEIEDPVQFNEAYRQFIQNYIKNESGGSIDPKIYQKYIGGAVSQTEHNITQQFLSERRRAMETKAVAAYTSSVDSSMLNTFGTAEYRKNRGAWVRSSIAEFNAKTKALADEIGDPKAGNAAANIMAASMNGLMSMNELNDMMAVAQANPLVWEDPNNKLQIQRVYTTQKSYIEQEARRREYEARYQKAENERKSREARFNTMLDFSQKNPNMSLNEFYDHFSQLGYKRQDILTAYRGSSGMRQEDRMRVYNDFLSGARKMEDAPKAAENGEITYKMLQDLQDNNNKTLNRDIDNATNQAVAVFRDKEADQTDRFITGVIEGAVREHAAEVYKNQNGATAKTKDPNYLTNFNQEIGKWTMMNFPERSKEQAVSNYRMNKNDFPTKDPDVALVELQQMKSSYEAEYNQLYSKIDAELSDQYANYGVWLDWGPEVRQSLVGRGATDEKHIDMGRMYKFVIAVKEGSKRKGINNGSRRTQSGAGSNTGNSTKRTDTGNSADVWGS